MPDLTLTAWEREVLAMPVVAGVLRRGSPIIATRSVPYRLRKGQRGIVAKLERRNVWHVVPDVPYRYGSPVQRHVLAIDLTDATGRAHLAWWVAGQVRTSYGGALDPAEGVRWHRSWRGHWELHGQRADEHRKWQEVCFLPWAGDDDLSDRNDGPHGTWCRFVPSLAHLDPNDPRLLPDGSRLVDALALGLVARHVAGLTIPEVTP